VTPERYAELELGVGERATRAEAHALLHVLEGFLCGELVAHPDGTVMSARIKRVATPDTSQDT
jgi:hypothetical protein